MFSGWFGGEAVLPSSTPATAPSPADGPRPAAKKEEPKLNPYRGYEYVDVDVIESILKDNNGLELQWLQGLLESGVKIRNVTGRYLKPDRFISQVKEARLSAPSLYVSE